MSTRPFDFLLLLLCSTSPRHELSVPSLSPFFSSFVFLALPSNLIARNDQMNMMDGPNWKGGGEEEQRGKNMRDEIFRARLLSHDTDERRRKMALLDEFCFSGRYSLLMTEKRCPHERYAHAKTEKHSVRCQSSRKGRKQKKTRFQWRW